jgi:putative component of membrane protein insertase Oxa1/YidC/SpoIIIJ protein YidD
MECYCVLQYRTNKDVILLIIAMFLKCHPFVEGGISLEQLLC